MALIEEIFKLFDEETRLNKIQGRLSSGNLEFKSDLLVLDLIKVDGNDLLFKSGTGACRIKVDGEINLPSLQAEETSVGIDYFFWVAKTDFEATKRTVTMSYLRRGRTERKNEIDIAFGDEVMYQMKVRDKVANIPSTLSSRLAFGDKLGQYLFIETFPNNDRNFRIHGLAWVCDVSIEDGKWIITRLTKKPFPKRFDDYIALRVAFYNTINYVEKTMAREAFETISLRDRNSGNTLLNLWEDYNKMEQQQALELKDKIGQLRYFGADQRGNGVTQIKLALTEEQEALFKERGHDILNASFSSQDFDGMIEFDSYDRFSHVAVVLDDNYPIKQGASGLLEVDLRGNNTADKRRRMALSKFRNPPSIVIGNLRLALEGDANKMFNRPRKEKPITAKTRKFMKEKFGIEQLTPDQEKAVDIAINTPDIAVIQGPPGTGKSTVVSVITQRLMEIAEKRDALDKLFLVSAFQHDTVEHIASKIYTMGLPTIKLGKEEQGVRSEEVFIKDLTRSIDNALNSLSPEVRNNRVSKKLEALKAQLEKEGNDAEVKKAISLLISENPVSDDLFTRWQELVREVNADADAATKMIAALRGLQTDAGSYSDDGPMKIRRLIRTGIGLTPEEREFLDDAPDEDEEVPAEFFVQLKALQEKYLTMINKSATSIEGGDNLPLLLWMQNAIEYFKEKEAKSYDDTDTFIAATLEDIREEIYGNAEHIREAIKQYSSSIAATNQFAGSAEIRDELYQNVILEEAARSNPLDLLIPLVKASERIIMVGDQRQLPHLLEPKIVDEIVNGDVDKKEKYKESLFGILFNSLAEAKPVRRITLTNQFRMHPVIGDFISKVYYNGAVKSDLVKVESKKHNLSLPWAKDKVAVLCHVPKAAGTEYRKDTSKTRRQEAQRIIRLLDELQTDPAFDNLSIGVITFYSGQVDLINELAEKNGYTEKQADGSYHTAIQYSRTQDGREKLRIGSVDSFQGKEFDVVILSTVRSNEIARVEGNESKVFGFLTLENRLNVAFSRAQKMIILVGDKDMFEDEFAASYVNGLYTFCTELTKGEYGNRIQ